MLAPKLEHIHVQNQPSKQRIKVRLLNCNFLRLRHDVGSIFEVFVVQHYRKQEEIEVAIGKRYCYLLHAILLKV